jgi:conjugal transfer mating pair stabilization protein TraG
MLYNHLNPATIDPEAYKPLLQTIAKGESSGNYNAYYGSSHNTTVHFTGMTIAEVLQWQEEFVCQGHPSSAVGKYQIVRPTLVGLVNQLGLSQQTTFNEATQDRLAVALLERRGSKAFIAKELTREQFATNLAKEWAALPAASGPNPEKSYYAGDGLNQARVSLNEVYTGLALFEQKAAAHRQ